MLGWLIVSLASKSVAAVSQATTRTFGAIGHYAFYRHECVDGSVAGTSHLQAAAVQPAAVPPMHVGAGATCLEGRQGINLSYPCALDYHGSTCTYRPLQTDGPLTSFVTRLGNSFTIEAWLAADPRPIEADASGQRVLLSLAAEEPDESTAGRDRCEITQPDGTTPISFELLQNHLGCVSLKFKLAADSCMQLPPLDRDIDACVAPAALDLDAYDTGTMQHLVISVNGASTTQAVPPSLPTFATYIDGSIVVNSSTTRNEAGDGSNHLSRGYFVGSALGDLLSNTSLNFGSVFNKLHVIRVGSDGYSGNALSPGSSFVGDMHAWGGRIHMVALYDMALNASEVLANFHAGPDNSFPVSNSKYNTSIIICTTLTLFPAQLTGCTVFGPPMNVRQLLSCMHRSNRDSGRAHCHPSRELQVAHNSTFVVHEDSCTLLPDLKDNITDFDVDGPLQRTQLLSAELRTAEPSRGGLYSDAGCTMSIGPSYSHEVYFQAASNEFSIPSADAGMMSPYTQLEWQASDGDGGIATGYLAIDVQAINDAPRAHDGIAEAYMAVRTLLHLNGSDVDNQCVTPSSSSAQGCRIRIASAPTHGTLYTEDLKPLAGLNVPQISMGLHNMTLIYESRSFPRECDDSCPVSCGSRVKPVLYLVHALMILGA